MGYVPWKWSTSRIWLSRSPCVLHMTSNVWFLILGRFDWNKSCSPLLTGLHVCVGRSLGFYAGWLIIWISSINCNTLYGFSLIIQYHENDDELPFFPPNRTVEQNLWLLKRRTQYLPWAVDARSIVLSSFLWHLGKFLMQIPPNQWEERLIRQISICIIRVFFGTLHKSPPILHKALGTTV